MRRALTALAALILPIALAAGPAAAASQANPGTRATQGAGDICGFTDRRPNLQNGSRGVAVLQAQCYLNVAIGAGLPQNGFFGLDTFNATRDFQRCFAILPDGRIVAQTWSLLYLRANAVGAPFFC